MSITPLPTPPQRSDADNFAERADLFLSALPTFQSEANALASDVNDDAATASSAASTATTKADAAAASAVTALNAPGTNATSTSSVTIGTGPKSLTIQTGKSMVAGMKLMVVDSVNPTVNFMYGSIESYNSGTGALVFESEFSSGNGTLASWVVSLSALAQNVSPLGLDAYTLGGFLPTTAAGANSVALRDNNGRLSVASPSDSTHVALKSTVDTAVALRAPLAGSSTTNFSVKAATTSYHATNLGQFLSSNAANGYQKLPSGYIMQGGSRSCTFTGSATNNAVVFPIAFPNACRRVIVSFSSTSVVNTSINIAATSITATGFNITTYSNNGFSATVMYEAVGD